jgi:hypothetical protein
MVEEIEAAGAYGPDKHGSIVRAFLCSFMVVYCGLEGAPQAVFASKQLLPPVACMIHHPGKKHIASLLGVEILSKNALI